MSNIAIKDNFYNATRDILQTAKDRTYKQVTFIMVEACWKIGKHRAKYGSAFIKELLEFDKGFTNTNLKMMRQFYNAFSNSHTLCDQFTWSHHRLEMYANMFDELEKAKDDNPITGIILCSDKDNTVVKYSSIKDKENLFVSKYHMYLLSKEELRAEIEKNIFELSLRVEVNKKLHSIRVKIARRKVNNGTMYYEEFFDIALHKKRKYK